MQVEYKTICVFKKVVELLRNLNVTLDVPFARRLLTGSQMFVFQKTPLILVV